MSNTTLNVIKTYSDMITTNVTVSNNSDCFENKTEEVLEAFAKYIVRQCNDNCIAELSSITSEDKLSKEERWNKTVWKKAIDKTLTQLK